MKSNSSIVAFRKKKVVQRLVAVIVALGLAAALVPSFSVSSARADAAVNAADGYFYDQLVEGSASVGIYETLEAMYLNGDLLSGTATVDLVQNGVLENRSYSQSTLSAEFSAARDAFFLDYSSVFYTDGDLLTLRQLTNSDGDYSITLGIGREDTYFSDGFASASDAENAEREYWSAVEEIAETAGIEDTYEEKVFAAYSYVSEEVSYALESTVSDSSNIPYVRNAYGAIIKGEACCEGYARAFKAILDVMGIPCVLVQGTFMSDTDGAKSHMWTYVRMDDNRWYMCDPTMQSGVASGDDTEYFLVNGRDGLMESYQEDGVISLSSSAYEFNYPILSGVEYAAPSGDNPFTIQENGAYYDVSYNGMGLKETENEGIYILVSYDSGSTWYYARLALAAAGITLDEADHGTYFEFLAFGQECTFAVTSVAPVGDDPLFNSLFSGDPSAIYDVSTSFGEQTRSTHAPYVVKSSAVCEGEAVSTRLSPEKTYTVTLKFSEALTLYAVDEPEVLFMANSYVSDEDVNVRDVALSDSGDELSFVFDTIQTYHSSLGYYFEIHGLIGKESRQAPNEVGFSVVNNPVFSCPYVEGSFNTVYATTPALIADSDLSSMDWVDEDGNPISDSIPHNFTLVVTSPTADEEENIAEQLEGLGEIAATYSITLGLCDKQVEWISGERVKVLIPFPEGYSYSDALDGVTFTAYHFDSSGAAEEIECVVTESGLIIYCEAFSPFAIVTNQGATSSSSVRKTAVITYDGGSADNDIIRLSEGGSATLKISADEGFVIDKIIVNGVQLDIDVTTSYELTLSYGDMNVVGGYVEVSFASADVVEKEVQNGFYTVVEEVEISEEPGGSVEAGVTEENGDDGISSGEGMPGWEIAVIVIAVVIVVAAVVVVVLVWMKNKKQKSSDADTGVDDGGDPGDVTP